MPSVNGKLSSQITMLEPTYEEFHQTVCETFNTTLPQIKKDVEVLKEWIRQQPHMPQNSSDALLTNFLVACKNRMERAKEKIDNYYTARSRIPEFYGTRDLEAERARLIAEEMRMFPLPKCTPGGFRVTMVSFATGDPGRFDVWAMCQRLLAISDVRFNHEYFYLGDYGVLDGARFSASHLLRITPTWAKEFIHCMQDVLPMRVKGVIVFNSPPYMKLVLNVLKPFIKGKLIQRFHFHTEGPEILTQYFPRTLLPRDYGGDEDTSENLHEAWCQILRAKRDWLMGEGALTVDEEKRVGGPSSRKDMSFQDLQGSFKTLCVD